MPTNNKVKYGLKNVHFALRTETTSGVTFGSVFAQPGAVSLTLAPAGENYEFYADGEKYFEYHSNNGYEGNLELAMLSEKVRKDILGELLDSANNLIEVDGVQTVYFAMGFEIEGDASARKYWLYKCSASRTNQDANTKAENIEVKTESLSFKAIPDPSTLVNGKPAVRITSTEANTAASTWFSAVVVPGTVQ